jgi:hypothetical protein
MLENKGVTCEVIDNGEDAIEVAKSKFRLNPNGYSFTWNKRHNCHTTY